MKYCNFNFFTANPESLNKSTNLSKTENIPSPYGDIDSVRTLIYLIQYSSNPYTLEAAAGSLQNLTAGHGSSSEQMREIVCCFSSNVL